MVLKKSDILKCQDLDVKKIYVKEWAGDVLIRKLSFFAQQEADKIRDDLKVLALYLIEYSVVDEDHRQLFDSDDLKELENKNADAITFLFKEILEHNKVRENQIEDYAKKS